MAYINLVGSQWIFNSTSISDPAATVLAGCKVDFTSNGKDYYYTGSSSLTIYFQGNDLYYKEDLVYNTISGWVNEAYRTIEILGAYSAQDSEFIDWLEDNATIIQDPVPNTPVPITHVSEKDTASAFVGVATGTCTKNGTSEFFECAFPRYDSSCYFYIVNGNVSAVRAKVLSNGAPGYVPSAVTISKNTGYLISFDPKYTKTENNTVILEITPNQMRSTAIVDIKIYAFYSDPAEGDLSMRFVDSIQLDADLTTIANAIRTKGGTSASLAFPNGFVSAVNAIPSGGGGTKYPAFVGVYTSTYNNSTLTVVTTYDTQTGNNFYTDEDGNAFDGTNGAFEYKIENGNWVRLSAGSTTISPGSGYHGVTFRFVNTNNNKPFGGLQSSGIMDLTVGLTITNNSVARGFERLFDTRNDATGDTSDFGIYSKDIEEMGTSTSNRQFFWLISGEED